MISSFIRKLLANLQVSFYSRLLPSGRGSHLAGAGSNIPLWQPSGQAGKLNSHVDGAHFLTGRGRGKKTIRKLWHVSCFDAFYQQWHPVSSGISCSDAGTSPSNSRSAVGCLQFSLFPPPKAEAPSVQTCILLLQLRISSKQQWFETVQQQQLC